MTTLITGANRGIGLEFTRQLLERGEEVIATARQPDKADDLQALADQHDGCRIVQLDTTDEDSVAELGDMLEDVSLDVLLNNAGRLTRGGGPDEGFDFDEIRGDFEVNVIGTLRMVETALDALRRGTNPRIINITSKMGSIADNGSGGSYAYRASKCALNMATRSLAIDLADEGIVALVIHPGWVKTRMGGPNALITPEKSVSNMLEIIDNAGADDSGEFFEWDGGKVSW